MLSSRLSRALPSRLSQMAFSLMFVVAVVRERPRVVHAHDVATLLPGLVGARLTGAALVYDSHELSSGVAYRGTRFRRVVDRIERLGIHRAEVVVTASDAIAARLQAAYDLWRTPVVVRNVCALPRPAAHTPPGGLRRRLGLGAEPLVLHQGAPAPQRGCEALVRAMRDVEQAHLVFLGKGDPSFATALVELAREAGVRDRVHFVPNVPLEDLLAHTAEADVGVALFEPSCENYRLTVPNKLFEYLAAGIPVLGGQGTETGRLIESLRVGWTTDPTDPRAVAAALQEGLHAAGDGALLERVRAADERSTWAEERSALTGAYRQLAAAAT